MVCVRSNDMENTAISNEVFLQFNIYIKLSSDRGYFASKLTCRRKLAAFVRNYIDIAIYYGFNALHLF
jgi:hypothetical protein